MKHLERSEDVLARCAEWHALRKGNDDAIERCVRLMFDRYQNFYIAFQMTHGMADGERAKALNTELIAIFKSTEDV